MDNNPDDRTSQIGRDHVATVIYEPRPGVCSARQAGTLAASLVVTIGVGVGGLITPLANR